MSVPGTMVVSILVAADILSAGVRTCNENSNDTSPNRKLHHPCVLVYKIQILTAVQQYQVPGICYAGTRSYLVYACKYLYTL